MVIDQVIIESGQYDGHGITQYDDSVRTMEDIGENWEMGLQQKITS